MAQMNADGRDNHESYESARMEMLIAYGTPIRGRVRAVWR